MKVLITDVLLVFAASVVVADRALQCYQCNSANDAGCDSSNVENHYIKSCPVFKDGFLAGKEPIACRKIVQNVEELPTQIIRECAYTGDKQLHGLRKQSNKGVKLLYFQCENADEGKPCNGSQYTTTRYLSLILLLVIIVCVVLVKY